MLDTKNTNKTPKKRMMNRLYKPYIFVDIGLISLSLYMGGVWLLNTQIAFICSFFIVFSSFVSYKKMIDNRVKMGDIGDDRDLLDKIEDPHDLHVEKEEEQKSSVLKQSVKNLYTSKSAIFSIYRLFSYLFLCLAVLFLIRHQLFNAIAFLIGLSAMPLASLVQLFFLGKSKD